MNVLLQVNNLAAHPLYINTCMPDRFRTGKPSPCYFEPTPNWERHSRNLREKTPSSFIRSESVYKDGNYPKVPDDFYDELGPENAGVTTDIANIDILTQKTILIPVSLFFSSAIVLLLITAFWKYGLSGLSPIEKMTTKMYRLAILAGISKNNYQTIQEYSLLLSGLIIIF